MPSLFSSLFPDRRDWIHDTDLSLKTDAASSLNNPLQNNSYLMSKTCKEESLFWVSDNLA